MTNPKFYQRAGGEDLLFGLRHSLVIRVSSLVIRASLLIKKTGETNFFP